MRKSKHESSAGKRGFLRPEGMTTHNPSPSDASTVCKGGTVNDDATRVGPSMSHSLGPRTA